MLKICFVLVTLLVTAYVHGYDFTQLQGYEWFIYSKAKYMARYWKKDTKVLINFINYQGLTEQTELPVELTFDDVVDVEFADDKLLIASQIHETRLGYKFNIFSFEKWTQNLRSDWITTVKLDFDMRQVQQGKYCWDVGSWANIFV